MKSVFRVLRLSTASVSINLFAITAILVLLFSIGAPSTPVKQDPSKSIIIVKES